MTIHMHTPEDANRANLLVRAGYIFGAATRAGSGDDRDQLLRVHRSLLAFYDYLAMTYTEQQWEEDSNLPEAEQIAAVTSMRTGRHDLQAEAERLVGARKSKAALVRLVNWLLHRIETKAKENERLRLALRQIAEDTEGGAEEWRLACDPYELARLALREGPE